MSESRTACNPYEQELEEVFAPQGPLSRRIERFAPRDGQLAMAQAVRRALLEGGVLISEAGTGTGKTLAYLVPALQSGRKVIVSTGTKTLQDQLYHRDLPLVRKALDLPVRIALLKGRANYLCVHRLKRAGERGQFASSGEADHWVRIRSWADRTDNGDTGEVTDVPEDAAIWPQVTSTVDNCLGTDCEAYRDCFLNRARRRAQEADVVVINHHLLLADMALRDDGFGELLPRADGYVLDEAHQLPETATRFFGVRLSSRQLVELANDTTAEQIQEAGDLMDLRSAADALSKAARDLRLALGSAPGRAAWSRIAQRREVASALSTLEETLRGLEAALRPASERGKGLDNCWRRCAGLLDRLDVLTGAQSAEVVQWVEIQPRSFSLHATPIHVAEVFREHMEERNAAWVFTSATLAVGESFSYFAGRMGIDDAQTHRWESPFEFAEQALLYTPPSMPNPNTPGYTDAVVDAALPVLEASRGRAFLLFTSHRALKHARTRLAGQIDYPLLVQGTAPRAELLERFRRSGNAVLLGTGSFWEGVDVRGPALSCVIIDKLPFASPDDPVLQARIQAMREAGRDAFREYQLPTAVISLKQGVGRLIRDADDRGVMMLCDPRLCTRPYGRVFLKSLPPMKRTAELDDVRRFFGA